MQAVAHAKINWTLRITGRRDDGFHDLETLFQTISLHDVLTFEESDRFALTCDDASIPTDDSNLILRAARALGAPPVRIHLEKRIPAGGGLGGGSANAAATLVTLARLPLRIRGYGHVKEANLAAVKREERELIASLDRPAPLPVAAE